MQEATRQRPGIEAGRTRHAARLCKGALSMMWMLAWVGTAAAFDTSCGTLPAWSPAAAGQFPAVVVVHASGRATGIVETWQGGKVQRRLAHGDFTLTGRGVVVGQFVVTAAHVVYPEKISLALDPYTTTLSPVVAIQQTTISVGALTEASRVSADLVHLNHEADLAVLRPTHPALFQAFPYAAADTWWREHPGEANSLLSEEDCIIALVPERDAHQVPLLETEARAGKVIASSAVSSSATVVVSLNPQTVTISTPVFPGDSGSPVLAFDMGEPRLVGIVSATRHPLEAKSYISRLDSLLPILDALHTALDSGAQVAQAR
jgi:Trypsin-like peptidase domain